ncbi:hypothetical protein [Nocardia panacis]|uniref:hypothetical protein n=1 Tax=Nocardia panacis TaxID=2340916 RepID=UPI0011C46F17|nr:hypothetical protein [Nocardia panacis]
MRRVEWLLGAMCAVLAVSIGAMAVLVPLSVRAERQRRRTLARWAAAHRWSFARAGRAGWTNRLPGRNRQGLGVTLSGRMDGRTVTIADYQYQTTSTRTGSDGNTHRRKHNHRYIVVMIQLDRAHPPVAITTRGLLSQLGRSLFGDRPTATGNPYFDRDFRVLSPNPTHAKELVGPPLMAAHLGDAVPTWSIVGTELVTYSPGYLRDPSRIPAYACGPLRIAALLGCPA